MTTECKKKKNLSCSFLVYIAHDNKYFLFCIKLLSNQIDLAGGSSLHIRMNIWFSQDPLLTFFLCYIPQRFYLSRFI